MTDFYSPTVIQPSIPAADMTVAEHLLLTSVLDYEDNEHGIYFFSDNCSDDITVEARKVREILDQCDEQSDDPALVFLRKEIAEVEAGDEYIETCLERETMITILQNIVKRSSTLHYITIVTSWTASKMCPEGYGGSATVITSDIIAYQSTNCFIDNVLREHVPTEHH